MMRLWAILLAIGAGLAAIGIAGFVWPVSQPVLDVSPTDEIAPSGELSMAVFEAPFLFEPPPQIVAVVEPESEAPPPPQRLEPPTLIGIAHGEPASIAWFRLSSGDRVGIRAGEVVEGWQLEEISDTAIVLRSGDEVRSVEIFSD